MALFMFRGTGAAYWLPEVASDNGPTETELAAGFKFSRAFNNIQGLEPQQSPINVAVLEHKTELTIEGPETFNQVTITIVEDDGTGTSQDALVQQEALDTFEDGEEGVLVLSRTKKDPEAGDDVYMIRGAFGRQTPQWGLDAAAAVTDCNLFPTSPLDKVKVLPAG